ncbi:alginate lyase family protein [Neobacillus niacini]|uniref:alginate lyase family protein n=1 Tax=Neobacillus niacini TaxID=86668 RepID=UPI0039838ADA
MQGDRQNPRHFWSIEDKEFIVSSCKKDWPNEINEVIQRADLACENTFIYTHRWDMERCETPVTFDKQIDWTYRLNGDFEWTVMLNRARYMSELGQAYWLTNNEKYAAGYIKLLNDWIAQNPLTEEEVTSSDKNQYNVKDTWRKLDSGIRIVNWLKGYSCIRQSSLWGEKLEKLFQEAVILHGYYLNIAFTPHDAQSNWGFLETNGLLQIALLYPELKESKEWLQTAINRMTKMADLQIFGDGMHNEQCSMYHHEVLNCLFESVLLMDRNNIQYPRSLKEKLSQMFTASLAFIKPNGHQPMLSDSDDTDIRDIMCHGAVLLHWGDLKTIAYPTLNYDGIWYFGKDGVEQYNSMETQVPLFTSHYLENSGYAIMRSDWSKDANYLLFDGGHMDLIRAHGHDDFLHIDLSAYGREFLIDSGRYTYMETADRQYFKESFQHNTLIVDGVSISSYKDSWTWEKTAKPVNSYWTTHPSYDYIQCGHNGYWKLEKPVMVLRQILFVKPDIWILIDTCDSDGKHVYEQHFHFAENVPVEIEADKGIVNTDINEGPNLKMIALTQCDIKQRKCQIARHYNQKSDSNKVIFKQTKEGFTKFVTILFPYQKLADQNLDVTEIDVKDSYGRTITPNLVTALEIKRQEKTDIILFSHQGPGSFQFAETHLSGEIILIKREEGKTEKAFIVKV